MASIKARRKLSDLYKRGVEVRFGPDDSGKPVGRIAPKGEGFFEDEDGKPIPAGPDDVQMWIQPPSPLHREMAMRDAQAARAKALVRAKREEDSEEHLTIMAFLADMSDETLIEYVLLQQQDEHRQQAVREVLGDDEWSDITAYQDALRQFDESDKTPEELENDPEYMALMELDIKFGKQVSEIETQIMDSARASLEIQLQGGRKNVEKKALQTRAETVGTQAFMFRYEQEMLFYSVRDFEENGALFYESSRQLEEEDEDIRTTIAAALNPFIQETAEAKNLQGVVSGLGSSEPPKAPATSEASTPETVNA